MPRALRRYISAQALIVLSLLILMSLPGGQNSLLSFLRPTASAASNFVVTNTNDDGPGSLRQAITDANASPGLDTISFNIGSGLKTIAPLQRLPQITDPVVIDGTTQPGFSGVPIIELNGSVQPDGSGLFITAGNSTVRGLVINRFHFLGILLATGGGNHVEGCYIGTDHTGTVAQSNGSHGISISNSNNVIGGTSAAQHNIISGNQGAGIDINRACCTGDTSSIVGNVIQGNYIGVNATGNAAIPNQQAGIRISSVNSSVSVSNNLVGGTGPGAGNVISGNRGAGIDLDHVLVTNNTVQGNLVGTDATGSFAISNERDGIVISGSNNLIGGPAPGARNIISGNGSPNSGAGDGDGVNMTTLSPAGNIVQGNIIGANATLTAPLPNLQSGVAINGSNNVIGGTGAGEGNVIAFSGFDGVVVATNTTAANNSIRGNSIFSNGRNMPPTSTTINIDLGTDGVTPNDAGDGDTGANKLQNFPVITLVTVGASSVNVKGTLNSTASQTFTLDFYANSVCDVVGFGGGARHLGTTMVTTDGVGDASFDTTFAQSLPANQVITATATDATGNTSEFSQCSPSSPAVGAVSFDPSFVQIDESSGAATFTLSRTGGTAGSLTVGYTVNAGTALPGSDYTPVTDTVTFADGQSSKTFLVPIIDDSVAENFESATITLSTNGALDTLGSQSVATFFIIDNDPLPPNRLQFSSASFTFNENVGSGVVTVTRIAPTPSEVTVRYTTSDTAGANNCNVINGAASSRCDFETTVGTLRFAVGETSKTISIPIIDDAYVEGSESFSITLSDPNGATLGTPSVATVNIGDNDFINGPNPISQANFFVRQHYLDFLNREPDAAGLAFWSGQITECEQPGATCSAEVRRINVSAAFFLSIEFQETGYFVYRTYKSSYGNISGTPVPLRLNEFLPDTQQIGKGFVVGAPGAEQVLENNKVAYLQEFVARARFTSAYPTTLTPAQFVDALFANAGVTPSAADRNAAIAEFNGAGNTADVAARARALRRVAENSTLKQQETNRAFVLMQYFGYLRRNPNDAPEANLDFGGYNFWLGKLNQFNGNFVEAEMVKAFIVSGEYRQRFGQ